MNTTLTAVTMLPVRRTHVTPEGEAGTISLQPGMYKFTVIGKRFENLTFNISIATAFQNPLTNFRKYLVHTEDFNFCCVSQLTTTTSVAVKTQRRPEGIESTPPALRTNITLIIERI